MDKENKVKGNRIDYIYVSKDLISKVTTAHFINDSFTATYSDHKPIIMEFKH
jgi:exodeoxyribonuclease-3